MHLESPRLRGLALACAAAAFALSPSTHAAEALVNGGFEADGAVIQSPDPFTAWTAAEDGLLGGVAIATGTSAPASGSSTVGAASGLNYAVLDLAAPSTMALTQRFTIGAQPVGAALLSFKWFANYGGTEGAFIDSSTGLDHTGDDTVLSLRVDILKAGADTFSTAARDLLFTRHYTAPLSAGPDDYVSFAQGLTGLVAGETYSLRFAAAANRGPLTVGIDDVSLSVTAVPEPSTWALMAAGVALVGAAARRRA